MKINRFRFRVWIDDEELCNEETLVQHLDDNDNFEPFMQELEDWYFDEGRNSISEFFDEFKRENIMQYTGLRDIDEVEICEWDILEYTSTFGGRTEVRNIVVSWSEEDGAYSFGGLRMDYVLRNSRVIGNVFENPELLN